MSMTMKVRHRFMAEHFEQILNSSILQKKSRRRDTSCGFCRQCIGRGGGGNESDQSGGHCGLTGALL